MASFLSLLSLKSLGDFFQFVKIPRGSLILSVQGFPRVHPGSPPCWRQVYIGVCSVSGYPRQEGAHRLAPPCVSQWACPSLIHPSSLWPPDTGTVHRFPTQRVYQETTHEINRNTAVFTEAETQNWKPEGHRCVNRITWLFLISGETDMGSRQSFLILFLLLSSCLPSSQRHDKIKELDWESFITNTVCFITYWMSILSQALG